MTKRGEHSIDGSFTRVSPAQFVEKLSFPLGWFVVRYSWVAEMSIRRKSHGNWYAITSDRNQTIYRMMRYSIDLKANIADKTGEIVLDWVGWIDLYDREEKVDGPLRLIIKPVPWWKLPRVFLRHPDPAIRLSSYLGWGSILLGALSLGLTIPWPAIWNCIVAAWHWINSTLTSTF